MVSDTLPADFERETLDLLARVNLPLPACAVEAGAGAGVVTRALLDSGWTVTAIEPVPQPALTELLDEQPERLTLIRGAVGGPGRFHVRDEWWNSGLNSRDPYTSRTVRTLDVPRVDLNRLLAARNPRLLVLDVEGAEARVLADLIPPARLSYLLVEWHPRLFSLTAQMEAHAMLEREHFLRIAYSRPFGEGCYCVLYQRGPS